MVADGPDDMFLVGDTHQRIYDNHVTLGSLGINIRGRSSRLTLSYRTTRQILATALSMLDGDELRRPRRRRGHSGRLPIAAAGRPARAPRCGLMDRRAGLIVVATAGLGTVGRVTRRLPADPRDGRGRDVAARRRRDCRGRDRTRRSTKPGRCPRRHDAPLQGPRIPAHDHRRRPGRAGPPRQHRATSAGSARYERERLRDRSLLFVAATRARDELAIFWHGTPSPFLSHLS